MDMVRALKYLLPVLLVLLLDILRFLILSAGSATSLRAENLFLRRQLAFYAERKIKAGRAEDVLGVRLAG
jgi:hypothetical protein